MADQHSPRASSSSRTSAHTVSRLCAEGLRQASNVKERDSDFGWKRRTWIMCTKVSAWETFAPSPGLPWKLLGANTYQTARLSRAGLHPQSLRIDACLSGDSAVLNAVASPPSSPYLLEKPQFWRPNSFALEVERRRVRRRVGCIDLIQSSAIPCPGTYHGNHIKHPRTVLLTYCGERSIIEASDPDLSEELVLPGPFMLPAPSSSFLPWDESGFLYHRRPWVPRERNPAEAEESEESKGTDEAEEIEVESGEKSDDESASDDDMEVKSDEECNCD